MTSDEKFAIATHLYVLLRRKCGRAIDTVWLAQNADYAREVVAVARAQADADLTRLAERFEALMFSEVETGQAAAVPGAGPGTRNYVGSLR